MSGSKVYQRIIIAILLVCMLVFAACGKKDTSTIQQAEAQKQFYLKSEELPVTDLVSPYSNLVLLGEGHYAVAGANAESTYLCVGSTKEPGKIQQFGLPEGMLPLAITMTKDADKVACLAQKDGGYYLTDYIVATGDMTCISIEDAEVDGSAVMSMGKTSDNNTIIVTQKKLYLLDSEGKCKQSFACPGLQFTGGTVTTNDTLYITYKSEDGSTVCLAKLDKELKKLCTLQGAGHLVSKGDNDVYFYDSANLYHLDVQKNESTICLAFADYDIVSSQILDFYVNEDGSIGLISWDRTTKMQYLTLSENVGQAEAKDEKQVIRMLGLWEKSLQGHYGELVAAFNKSNDKYRVEIDAIEPEGRTTDELKQLIHARLLGSECPDILVVTDYKDLPFYENKGVLLDLIPYIDAEGGIVIEDYQEQILQCFQRDGSLYGMPVTYSVETLGGSGAVLGEAPGWTVDEFLHWLEAHPLAKAWDGLSKTNILQYCLAGGIEGFVDVENDKAAFDSDEFKRLLSRVKELQTDTNTYYDSWHRDMTSDEVRLEVLYCDSFEYLISTYQSLYGSDFVYKGYPSHNGEPVYLLSMSCLSIPANSSCPEGAFAFWEYIMTYEARGEGDTKFHTQKQAFEQSLTNAQKDETVVLNGEQLKLEEEDVEKIISMLAQASPDTAQFRQIRNIVLEEADGFFSGNRDVNATCDVIQNRVQLYLDEN